MAVSLLIDCITLLDGLISNIQYACTLFLSGYIQWHINIDTVLKILLHDTICELLSKRIYRRPKSS